MITTSNSKLKGLVAKIFKRMGAEKFGSFSNLVTWATWAEEAQSAGKQPPSHHTKALVWCEQHPELWETIDASWKDVAVAVQEFEQERMWNTQFEASMRNCLDRRLHEGWL